MKNPTFLFRYFQCAIFFCFTLVMGCTEEESDDKQEKMALSQVEYSVIGVDNVEVKFKDGSIGRVVYFKSNKFSQCNLTFPEKLVSINGEIEAKRLAEKNIDITCIAEEGVYTLSDSYDGLIQLSVKNDGNRVNLELNLKLFDVRAGAKFEVNGIFLSLTQNDF